MIIGYIIGIIWGLYFKISIVPFYIILIAIYIIIRLPYQKKKFKIFSIKRYFRYIKLIFKINIIIIIIISSFISNSIIKVQNYKYDKLFLTANPGELEDYLENLNPESLVILKDCKIDADLKDAKIGDSFQFMRNGYFTVDKNSTEDKMIFNLTASLKDSYKIG